MERCGWCCCALASADMGVTNMWRCLDVKLKKSSFISCALGNKCRTGQSLQQQAEEAVEAVEICRMLRKEGKLRIK